MLGDSMLIAAHRLAPQYLGPISMTHSFVPGYRVDKMHESAIEHGSIYIWKILKCQILLDERMSWGFHVSRMRYAQVVLSYVSTLGCNRWIYPKCGIR
jgi:hypothetical protein